MRGKWEIEERVREGGRDRAGVERGRKSERESYMQKGISLQTF